MACRNETAPTFVRACACGDLRRKFANCKSGALAIQADRLAAAARKGAKLLGKRIAQRAPSCLVEPTFSLQAAGAPGPSLAGSALARSKAMKNVGSLHGERQAFGVRWHRLGEGEREYER
jgi:hypothetical protein